MKLILLSMLIVVSCGKDPVKAPVDRQVVPNNFIPQSMIESVNYPSCLPGSECRQECLNNTDMYCSQYCSGSGDSRAFNNCNNRCVETYPNNCPKMFCETSCKDLKLPYDENNACINSCMGY